MASIIKKNGQPLHQASTHETLEENNNNNNNNNNDNSNNNNKKWKSPTKETVSSRLRREMNTGKGARIRSKTTGSQDENADVNTWVKEKMIEQKKTLKSQENEIEELENRNKILQEKVNRSELKIEESLKVTTEKEEKLKKVQKEKTACLIQSENLKLQNNQLQMKLSTMEATQGNLDNSVQTLLNDIDGKNNELVELRAILEKERKEKSNLVGQYNMKVQDRSDMNQTLQREVELLKDELDKQLTSSNIMKNDIENKLKETESKLEVLTGEKSQLEETCHSYETEVTDRIRENLKIMNDYDNAKTVEHKNLNFINELTKSNQELTNSTRKQQNEIEEMKTKLRDLEIEINEERNSGNEAKKCLEDDRNKLQQLEDARVSNTEELDSKSNIISRLTKQIGELELNFKETNETLEIVTMQRDHYEKELNELEKNQDFITKELQKEKDNFDKRDKEQTEFLNQLVNDLKISKQQLHETSELTNKVNFDLTNEKDKNKLTNAAQLGIIKDLEKQLVNSENSLIVKNSNIDKLTDENKDVNQKLAHKVEMLETVKLENNDYKIRFEQSRLTNEALQKELSEVEVKSIEKETECQSYRANIEMFEHTTEQQGQIFADLRDQNDDLRAQVRTFENEADELKEKIGECVEKHNNEAILVKDVHSKVVDDLQTELEQTRTKSQEEINELLNNFNEVENELSFCQDELLSKTKDVNKLSGQLTEMTKSGMNKEQQLLTDLETLNEQNENILQSEIKKYKTECEEQVLTVQKRNDSEMSKLQKDFHAKLTSLREVHAREKANEIESLKSKHNDRILQTSMDKEKLDTKLADQTRIESDLESKLRSRDVELTSKSRIIDQLGRRIETQQKLIDYMMKSLEVERSKHNNKNGDIMLMLSNLQSTLDEKLDPGEMTRGCSNLSSMSSEGAISPRPLVHFSIGRNQYASTSDASALSPLPSPNVSPMRETFVKEDFTRYLTSSPAETDENHIGNITYPWSNAIDINSYLDNQQQCKQLSKSLPEAGFVDLGYVSPTIEKNTRTIYFGEQIQTIMRTFEKIEALQTDNSPNKELNLEIWKQKIHFRLKVLEDQMSECDTASVASSRSGDKVYPALEQPRKVLFHPSTQEIRELIENVNTRYQKLGRKYLSTSALL